MLQVHQNARVLSLILDRPEKRNALNVDLCRDLVTSLERADADPTVGAILLAANGKSFCAGMDLSEAIQTDRTEMDQLHERLFTIGYRLRKPILAAVHGAALAGGTGLIANAHVVVATEDASFGLTEIRIGLWPILIFRAVKVAVGERRATELALTGRRFNAREALALGLVHEIHAAPVARAEQIAAEISQFSPQAVVGGLEYVNRTRDTSWEEAGRIGREIRQGMLESPEFREGVGRVIRKP